MVDDFKLILITNCRLCMKIITNSILVHIIVGNYFLLGQLMHPIIFMVKYSIHQFILKKYYRINY